MKMEVELCPGRPVIISACLQFALISVLINLKKKCILPGEQWC